MIQFRSKMGVRVPAITASDAQVSAAMLIFAITMIWARARGVMI